MLVLLKKIVLIGILYKIDPNMSLGLFLLILKKHTKLLFVEHFALTLSLISFV